MDNSYKKINQKKKFFHIKLYIIFSVSYVYNFQFFKNTFDLIKKKSKKCYILFESYSYCDNKFSYSFFSKIYKIC